MSVAGQRRDEGRLWWIVEDRAEAEACTYGEQGGGGERYDEHEVIPSSFLIYRNCICIEFLSLSLPLSLSLSLSVCRLHRNLSCL